MFHSSEKQWHLTGGFCTLESKTNDDLYPSILLPARPILFSSHVTHSHSESPCDLSERFKGSSAYHCHALCPQEDQGLCACQGSAASPPRLLMLHMCTHTYSDKQMSHAENINWIMWNFQGGITQLQEKVMWLCFTDWFLKQMQLKKKKKKLNDA